MGSMTTEQEKRFRIHWRSFASRWTDATPEFRFAAACKACQGEGIGHGPEGFTLPEGEYPPQKTVEYLNMGDTYDRTAMLVNGRLRFGSRGAIAERFEGEGN